MRQLCISQFEAGPSPSGDSHVLTARGVLGFRPTFFARGGSGFRPTFFARGGGVGVLN